MNRLDEVGDDFRDMPMAALYEVSRVVAKNENKTTKVIELSVVQTLSGILSQSRRQFLSAGRRGDRLGRIWSFRFLGFWSQSTLPNVSQ